MEMQNFKTTFLVSIFFLGFTIFVNGQTETPQRVLFVGNSYTYFWNLPQNVALMAESQKIDLTTHQSTSGGVSLGHHWRGDRGLETVEKIKEGDFDIVILQDHSRRAIDHPDSLILFGKKIGNLIKKSGAQPYLYMTWAREWDPYMQKTITKKYIELAEKINARIVPVGPAWQRARTLRPDIKLYDPDGSHPNTTGTYLTACVFYGILTNQSPVGLPNRLVSKDIHGEKLFINIQSSEDALFCQKVAEEIINEMVD